MAGSLHALVGLVVHVTIALVAFGVGMTAASELANVLRLRRGLVVRSLLGVLVTVPLAAVLLVKAIDLPRAVTVGVLVSAIAIGPVAALSKSAKEQAGVAFALALDLLLLVLSLAFVPMAVWAIGAAFQRELHLGVGVVARVILPLQLLPLLAGLAVGRFAPGFTKAIARPLALGTNLMLGAIVVLVLVLAFKPMLGIGARGFLVLAVLSGLALTLAHLLGGPTATDRRVLAAFMTLRFPALALALARLTSAPRTVVPTVVAYIVLSALAYALYTALAGRLGRGASGLGKGADHPTESRPHPAHG